MIFKDLTLFFVWAWIQNSRKHAKLAEKYKGRREHHPERIRAAKRAWFQKNKERLRERKNEWAEAHREEISQKHKIWREVNNARLREQGRAARAEDPDRYREYGKRYRLKNPDLVSKRHAEYKASEAGKQYHRNWQRKRRAEDPNFRTLQQIRTRIYHATVAQRAEKSSRTVELLGLAIPDFRAHIASLFKPEWSWENYGRIWELDHIKPCASFDLTDPAQQRQCFHWTNYQPLSIFDNRSKGAKWPR